MKSGSSRWMLLTYRAAPPAQLEPTRSARGVDRVAPPDPVACHNGPALPGRSAPPRSGSCKPPGQRRGDGVLPRHNHDGHLPRSGERLRSTRGRRRDDDSRQPSDLWPAASDSRELPPVIPSAISDAFGWRRHSACSRSGRPLASGHRRGSARSRRSCQRPGLVPACRADSPTSNRRPTARRPPFVVSYPLQLTALPPSQYSSGKRTVVADRRPLSSADSVMIQIFPPCFVVYAPMIRAPVLSASALSCTSSGAKDRPSRRSGICGCS